MKHLIRDYIDALSHDNWRDEVGFEASLQQCSDVIFAADEDASAIRTALGQWLLKNQPCLFGRIAARNGQLAYCILTESDLSTSDDAIKNKIQDARLSWLRDAYAGNKSGFVIAAVSRRIAFAQPDETLKGLALRLCSLYLDDEVVADTIYHDKIFLQKPGALGTTWAWKVGANYFCANGDKRWWQDHRFPAGLAFSMNSVGHMVKSAALVHAQHALDAKMGGPPEAGSAFMKLQTLGDALLLAMKTINQASNAPSGRATQLLSSAPESSLNCPIELKEDVASKNFCQYEGFYHTDYTVPSEYFRPDVERPPQAQSHLLDFTYLFDGDVDNPDHITMGAGRQVRAGTSGQNGGMELSKAMRTDVALDSEPLLAEALRADQVVKRTP